MNVIRMIKLFGWEPKVAAQLSEKREEELELVKKNKLLDLVNNNLKCVLQACCCPKNHTDLCKATSFP